MSNKIKKINTNIKIKLFQVQMPIPKFTNWIYEENHEKFS